MSRATIITMTQKMPIPIWSIAACAIKRGVLAVSFLSAVGNPMVSSVGFLALLGAALRACVLAAVHHAEVVAHLVIFAVYLFTTIVS